MKKVFALGLCVLLFTLGGCAGGASGGVVAKVGDEKISYDEYKKQLDATASYYGIDPQDSANADTMASLKADTVDSMIEQKVVEIKEAEMGIQPTDEDRASAAEQAETWYSENLSYLASSYAGSGSEDPEAQAKEYLDSLVEQLGYTQEYLTKIFLANELQNRLYEQATADVTVSDEDMRAQFDALVQDAKDRYSESKSDFYDDVAAGSEIYYTPGGFYYIKHILIKIDDEIRSDISVLRSEDRGEEADAMRDEALKLIKEKAEGVLAKVNADGDFDGLIAQYGEDPGMTVDPYQTSGYLFYENCASYVAEFTAAANELKADDAVSGLVATDFGYHIIKRVSTLSAAEANFEDHRESIRASLLEQSKLDRFYQLIDQWKEEIGYQIYDDKL